MDHFEAAFFQSPLATLLVRPNGELLNLNGAAERLLGLKANANLSSYLSPEEIQKCNKAFQKIERGEISNFRTEMQLTLKVGSPIFVMAFISIARPTNNSPQKSFQKFFIVQLEDISIRKRSEERLKFNEERFRAQFRNLPIPTLVFKWTLGDFLLFDLNQAALTLTNDRIANQLGHSAVEIVGYDNAKNIQDCLNKKHTFCDNKKQTLFDNRVVVITYSFTPPDYVLLHFEDLTEKVHIENELEVHRSKALYSAKMASLGEMASSVAHEINTPLTIISGYSEQMIRQLKSIRDSNSIQNSNLNKTNNLTQIHIQSLEKSATNVLLTAEKIAEIIKGLRSFGRDGSQDPFLPCTVEKLITETLSLCREKFSAYGIPLQVSIQDPKMQIECRTVQIEEVLLNLLNNSFDAVTADQHGKNSPWVRLEVYTQEENIEIAVTDSGPGIPPEIRNRIMEPFFSTKGEGKGTGLGLSISKAIIQTHQGKFELDDKCPNTKFLIRLPIRHKNAA